MRFVAVQEWESSGGVLTHFQTSEFSLDLVQITDYVEVSWDMLEHQCPRAFTISRHEREHVSECVPWGARVTASAGEEGSQASTCCAHWAGMRCRPACRLMSCNRAVPMHVWRCHTGPLLRLPRGRTCAPANADWPENSILSWNSLLH
jgi:hypothetical protein